MLYYIAAGAVALITAGLLKPHLGKKRTSECLKCNEGIGQEQRRKSGKVSFKCDHCGSTWVEGL